MDFPLVSIIVPVFNVEEYLERCLISIKNQTYSNIEVLIVNDGSTDNSKAIAEKYLTDTRFHLINKDNGGLASVRSVGLKKHRKNMYVLLMGEVD